jgi:hypothetical protein
MQLRGKDEIANLEEEKKSDQGDDDRSNVLIVA